ncbi:MAG TPA: hypothetical protein VEB43_00435 [Anaeromyxobacter sp.]|nr:hypothetical protein [Anaeromyxobacter sp.]
MTFPVLLLAALTAGAAPDPALVEWAREAEEGMPRGEMPAVTLDADHVIRLATRGVPGQVASRSGFTAALRTPGFGGTMLARIAKEYGQQIGDAGSFRLLRVEATEYGATALFRLMGDDGRFNYLRFELRKASGGILLRDFFNFGTGQSLVGGFRSALFVHAAEQGGELEGAVARYRDVVQHTVAKKHQEVLTAYHALPPALQKEELFLRARIQAALALDSDDLGPALAQLRKLFPDAPPLDVALVTSYAAQGRWEDASVALERLDRAVKDPYLDLERAVIALETGDRRAARRLAEKAIEAEPKLGKAYLFLIGAGLRWEDHALVADVLRRLERATGLTILEMEKEPSYAAFLRSAEYRAWKAEKTDEEAASAWEDDGD